MVNQYDFSIRRITSFFKQHQPSKHTTAFWIALLGTSDEILYEINVIGS